jgi:hypothetical protein
MGFGVDRDDMFVHVILVHMVKMAVVKIIHMAVMANRGVPAFQAMLRDRENPLGSTHDFYSARFCLGPDPRRALGPAAIPAASTGRTRDRTRPMLQKRQKVLARAPSTRDPTRTSGLISI